MKSELELLSAGSVIYKRQPSEQTQTETIRAKGHKTTIKQRDGERRNWCNLKTNVYVRVKTRFYKNVK